MKDTRLDSLKRLQHIEQAINAIQSYVAGETMERFCKNDLLHDAVLFQFTVIGEAIIHVENDLLEKQDYPWYKVRSFRNLIAHEYFNIKLTAVWQIIHAELPNLNQAIETVIKTNFENS